MIPVILSGGSGARLWPLSREQYPKQLLPLTSQHTLIQETAMRLDGMDGNEKPVVICNAHHRFLVAQQLRQVGITSATIILEPVGKNTAPAAAIAAMVQNPDDILLVLPADHSITDVDGFQAAVAKASQLAAEDYLVTFGVVPTAPETGYGYIKAGNKKTDHAFCVASFVEKPNAATAQQYIDQGNYYWNSGMFCFKAKNYLAELGIHHPKMLSSCEKAHASLKSDLDFLRLDPDIFAKCPSQSIDFAVMEHTDKAVVIPLDVGWSDVGSWDALWEIQGKDSCQNAITGDAVAIDSSHCLLHSEGRLITAIGVNNLVVVETPDAVLVADKNQVQEVKKVVDKLKDTNRSEAVSHRKIYRPWGYYDVVDFGKRHNTKRIVVNPGAKLSIQKHHHRSEHWIIVKGTALVTKDEEKMLLTENESTYIPLGTVHRLENPGVIALEMIEVQSGSYLGEDDITRYEDKYGRM